MKKTLNILFFLVSTITINAQWVSSTISPSTTGSFYDIDFTPDTIGWSVQYSPASVYKSNNHGTNWAINNSFSNRLLKSVHFISEQNGLIGGLNTGLNVPSIYSTTNGGLTWVESNIQSGNSGKIVNYISFSDSLRGFAFGHNGLCLFTTNGVDGSWINYPSPSSAHIWSGYIVSSDTFFAASSKLYMNTQMFSTWNVVYNDTVFDLDFTSIDTAYAITPSNIIKSTNGGLSWNIISSHSLPNIAKLSLRALNNDVIYISGGNREIYISTNAGINWTSDLSYLSGYHIMNLKVKNGVVWATGFLGQLLHKDPVSVGMNELTNHYPFSIYPNPVSTQLTINTELDINRIEILDITGNTLKTITPTTNTIDVKYLSNGIYFIKLVGQKTTTIQKFMKQ